MDCTALMDYTHTCQALDLWPSVIADLIGGYAEYTLEERLADLFAGSRIIVWPQHVQITLSAAGDDGHEWWHGKYDAVVLGDISGRRGLSISDMIESIIHRRWRAAGTSWQMDPDELTLADAILENIRFASGIYHGPLQYGHLIAGLPPIRGR